MSTPQQETKVLSLIPPTAIKDNAAFVSTVIDKNDLDGADYLDILGHLGATDVEMAQLRVMESDTLSDATTLGGSPSLVKDATTKPGADDDNKVFAFGLDLSKSRKRYLQLQATAGDGTAGTFLSAIAIASRPREAGSSATRRGLLFAEYA